MDVQMGLVEFAAEFILVARRDVHEAPGLKKALFTSRQSQAITSLGISRLVRKGESLGLYDLVTLSVITSPPEAQKYAELIAFRILVGDERDLFSQQGAKPRIQAEDDIDDESLKQLTGAQLLLSDILDFLNLSESVDPNKDRAEMKFAEIAEDFLFNLDENQNPPTSDDMMLKMRRKEQFVQVGGRNGILSNKIASWEDLNNASRKSIIKSIPNMSTEELLRANAFGMGKEVRKLTREKKLCDLSELLQGSEHQLNNGFSKRGKEIISSLSSREKINALKTLYRYNSMLHQNSIDPGISNPSLSNLIEQIEDAIQNEAKHLDDILDFPHLFSNDLSHDRMLEFINESHKSLSSLDLLEKSQAVDDLLGTNFSDMVSDMFEDEFLDMDMDDWLERAIPSAGWVEQFQDKISDYNGHTTREERKSLLQKMQGIMDSGVHPYINSILDQAVKDQLVKYHKQAGNLEELTESVNYAKDNGYSVSTLLIKELGKELGIADNEIAKLIGDIVEHLNYLMEEGKASYERVKSLTSRNKLDNSQITKLAKKAVKHQSEGTLASLMEDNFSLVVKNVPQNSEGRELLEQAMGAGDGENLLQNWFKHANSLPHWMRAIVRDAAKRIMIDLAKVKAAALIGSSEAGPLPEGTTRPLILGDDPDTIDLDETLENILYLGKKVEQVSIEDFIVRKTVSGRRCVIFLVDVSGSMSGPPLASATLTTTMLLYAFSRDELGIALFESNTHVICEINEKIEIDTIADKLLDLRAMGGTQMQRALEWAEHQFKKSASQDKMFVMVTDAMIGDFDRSSIHLRNIADQGATAVLIMPGSGYGLRNINEIVSASSAQLITVDDWKKFPEVVSKILSRL